MPNPGVAMIVIGDELLSGRTRDSNMHHLAGELTKAGFDLREVRVVGDDQDAIAGAVNSLRATHDQVFTSGGIGPTHDDITADSVAAAFGLPIGVREDAKAILEEHCRRHGIEMNAARLRMARVPEGAVLIDNPVSSAPGFSLDNVHVLAGVPAIFEAMVASVLPTLVGGAPIHSEAVRVNLPEGEIAGPLRRIAEAYAGLSFGSYPFVLHGRFGVNLVVRGTDPELLGSAVTELQEAFPDAVT
ncbi:competence/damage-inducible protein A [Achromobacter marplatensis]|uniref:competence/damage-inducible protein A n=1 Tax=Achromobacter marplatensis TaxID=470868 RepID=UPI003CFFD12B